MKNHAIVIGGSLAGLLAARVLSDFYARVTVVERDVFTAQAGHRRGVPQGRHAHGLLASGSRMLEELFPDISNELTAAGALPADVVNDGKWFFEGACLKQEPSTTMGILLSRPLLEFTIRKRVRDIDNVSFMENRTVRQLISNGNRVSGVHMDAGSLRGDLVVDASGRGSQTFRWLRSLGFPAPREEKVGIDVAYTSRTFRRRETDLGGDLFAVIPATPLTRQSGVILAQEGGLWKATLIGRLGVQPPEDLEGFVKFAKNLEAPFIYQAIRNAVPVGESATMRFPASIRRRYEELKKTPEGFLAFGDAICSFNPVYGQGMSVAALQAGTLQKQVAAGIDNLPQRFYKAAAKVIDIPWSIAVGNDLKMPETIGKRTLGGKLMGWYIGKLHRLGHHDAQAATAFLRVAQLLDEPSALLSPRLALTALWSGIGHKGAPSRTKGQSATARPARAKDKAEDLKNLSAADFRS